MEGVHTTPKFEIWTSATLLIIDDDYWRITDYWRQWKESVQLLGSARLILRLLITDHRHYGLLTKWNYNWYYWFYWRQLLTNDITVFTDHWHYRLVRNESTVFCPVIRCSIIFCSSSVIFSSVQPSFILRIILVPNINIRMFSNTYQQILFSNSTVLLFNGLSSSATYDVR